MLEIIKLGSLYIDGRPQKVGSKFNNGQITFGPAVPGKELHWVKVNNLLIADRCVCTNISWEQLDDQGLVFGTPVWIDGQFYLCRCLKVGAEDGVPNEWEATLDEMGEGNDLWHWKGVFFWGQETLPYNASYRAVRGYYSARYWLFEDATYRYAGVGFRPALKPLGPEPCSPDTLIGKQTRLYGPRGATLEGRLLSADDYDLLLKSTSSLPDTCAWASKDRNNLVVDRASVLWMKEA